MKLFVCDDHDVIYFTMGKAVILAENEAQARQMLDKELIESGLRLTIDVPIREGGKPTGKKRQVGYTLQEIDISKSQVVNFEDGDY